SPFKRATKEDRHLPVFSILSPNGPCCGGGAPSRGKTILAKFRRYRSTLGALPVALLVVVATPERDPRYWRKMAQCERAGRCSGDPGNCEAESENDCRSSTLCSGRGMCRLEEGGCELDPSHCRSQPG